MPEGQFRDRVSGVLERMRAIARDEVADSATCDVVLPERERGNPRCPNRRPHAPVEGETRYGEGTVYPASTGSGPCVGIDAHISMSNAYEGHAPVTASTPERACPGARLTAIKDEAVAAIMLAVERGLSRGNVGRVVDPNILCSQRVVSEIERHAKEIWAFIDREIR